MYSLLLAIALLTPGATQQPITFQYFYDDLGQLIKVVDSTGIVIEYVYDAVGNILEIKRSTISDLAILDFSPRQGPVGTTVTIRGQGFSATPAENLVQFNGIAATLTSATATSLVVRVPPRAKTGPISLQVGANTATSSSDFVVTRPPVLRSISPIAAFAGTTVPNFQINGTNLASSTFAFLPDFVPPAILVDAVTMNSAGTSATLSCTISAGTTGQFVVVATNAEGSSDLFPSGRNTFSVIDPQRAEADSDGDDVRDGLEVVLGSNPHNPRSIPDLVSFITEATASVFAVSNLTNPGQSSPVTEAVGATFAVSNLTNPGQSSPVTEAVSPTVSVQNQP
jgi:YD repeat-containing protein